jgi:hypothetical protein
MSHTADDLRTRGLDPDHLFDRRFRSGRSWVSRADAPTLERMNAAAKLFIDADLETSQSVFDITDPGEMADFLEAEARRLGLMS